MKAVTIVSALTATITVGTFTTAVAQDPPQQPAATIRLAVDRVPVDVSIVGDDGRPVTGLTATTSRSTSTAAPGESCRHSTSRLCARRPPPAASQVDLQLESGGAGGRLIMFVVDRGNIAPGRGRQAMEAAGRFLSRLSPADRVGSHRVPWRQSVDRFHLQSLSRPERADRPDWADRHVSDVVSHRHLGSDGDRPGRSDDPQHRRRSANAVACRALRSATSASGRS